MASVALDVSTCGEVHHAVPCIVRSALI